MIYHNSLPYPPHSEDYELLCHILIDWRKKSYPTLLISPTLNYYRKEYSTEYRLSINLYQHDIVAAIINNYSLCSDATDLKIVKFILPIFLDRLKKKLLIAGCTTGQRI